MLKDFGALVLIVIYLLAVIAMELVGSQPERQANSVPGFNSFGAAIMSIFLVCPQAPNPKPYTPNHKPQTLNGLFFPGSVGLTQGQ